MTIEHFATASMQSCGYSGARASCVASALNQMFAPELAVAQMATAISSGVTAQLPDFSNLSIGAGNGGIYEGR